MSTYVREKVLRIPVQKLNWDFLDELDDTEYDLAERFPGLFRYGTEKMFSVAPTEEFYIDYVLEREYDAAGEFGKVRPLYESEKNKYADKFKQLSPDVNMDDVKLVEFCWYNATEAPDYYDETKDDFYEEV